MTFEESKLKSNENFIPLVSHPLFFSEGKIFRPLKFFAKNFAPLKTLRPGIQTGDKLPRAYYIFRMFFQISCQFGHLRHLFHISWPKSTISPMINFLLWLFKMALSNRAVQSHFQVQAKKFTVLIWLGNGEFHETWMIYSIRPAKWTNV